jgi:hypothetical protein
VSGFKAGIEIYGFANDYMVEQLAAIRSKLTHGFDGVHYLCSRVSNHIGMLG